ncbi:MAG: MipA/OmpV family protein [Kiritimatiellae bacterium]|nr:MipA/OmpV family protein [Kiritimatiellia bacterium]
MDACKMAAVLAAACAGAGASADDDGFHVSGCGSFDVSSGYVLYGARYDDEPCGWTYGEVELGYGSWGSIGVGLWQNSDLTTRRKDEMRRMNEWDWSAFCRSGVDVADGWRCALEAGHFWYVYHGIKPVWRDAYKTSAGLYAITALENPFATPYFECYYDYRICRGAFLQGGLRHAFDLPFGLTLTPDFTVGGGSRNYNACMYPPYDGSAGGGVSYVQLAGTLAYWFNDHFGIHLKVAYAVLTDDYIRHAVDEDGGCLATDFVWGMVGVDVAF